MCVKLPKWSQGRNSQGAGYWAKERNETAELLHWETYVVHLHIHQRSKDFLICSCSLENYGCGCLELHQSCRTYFGFSGKLYRVAMEFINEYLSLSGGVTSPLKTVCIYSLRTAKQSLWRRVFLLCFLLKNPKKLTGSNNNLVAPSKANKFKVMADTDPNWLSWQLLLQSTTSTSIIWNLLFQRIRC